ncbi:RCC1-like domain-containing protein [Salinispora arenicola]|uniref:RCC1-like domain-containing protein n=1 Tax=Salinispora arenicola TaxID=168697 RepID=UPI000309B465|nr:RCC1 domain-containing protein [Salinispora arenicola]
MLAVLLTQAVGVLPAVAQHAPTSTIASDTILAWGDNSFGQFGNGSTTSSSTPVAVSLPAGTTVTAIAAGSGHSLAVTSTVTCTTDTPSGTITFRTTTTDLATVPLDSTTTATHTLTAHYTATTTTCPDSQSEATTITAPDDPDLPVTGPNLPTILGTATLLILTGATLVQLTRRTRATARPR